MRRGILALVAFAVAASAAVATPTHVGVAVPMRDGVVLRCDVFLPRTPGPFPALLHRTPYDRRGADEATFVAKAVDRGYAIVVQDVRGRYGSDGEFEPYRNEGRDGYDTIEWIASQFWSDGNVGTFGLSYPGAVQWLAATESPPHLKAMAPAMTFSTPRNFFYSGGVFDLSWIPWIWNNIAPDVRRKKGLDGPKATKEAAAEWKRSGDAFRRRLPLKALSELRSVAPYYFTWLDHAPSDPWWDWAEIRGKYEKVNAAVLNLSGWHDEAYGPEGAATNHLGLVASRASQDRKRTHLVLGPWAHGVPGLGKTRFGEREMGAAAAIDYDALLLRFFDHYVRGIDNGFDREPPVRAFVMGENRWIEGEGWPFADATEQTLYLAGGGGRRHALLTALSKGGPSSTAFVSDPARPVTDRFASNQGAHDYRYLLDRRDVAVFETPPLDRDLRVVGAVRAEIHVSSDAPDADLWAKVLDVAPDGTALSLMNPGNDVQRISFRDGGPRQLLRSGEIVAVRFDKLFIGNLFRRGHRLRLVLMPSFFPHFSQNLHTGELENDSSRTRRARIEIRHSATHPSRLILPVLP